MDREQLLHLCRLARLEPSEDELGRLRDDLGRILKYVETLSELASAGTGEVDVDETPALGGQRDDAVRPSLDPEATFANAARRIEDYFAVPPVLPQDSNDDDITEEREP